MSGASRLALAALVASLSTAATAAEFSGYVTATTDYVWRGVSQSDGDPAIQLGLDFGFDSGFYAGAWVSTIDLGREQGYYRDREVNYYAGYARAAGERWMLGGNVIAYTYPGMRGSIDYDYREYTLTANYDDTFWIEYAYSPDLYNSGKESHNIEAHVERAITGKWLLGGGAGYYDVSRATGSGYGYWQLGLSRFIGQFGFDLRYHDTNRPVPFLSSPERADSRVAFSITFSF